MWSIGGTTRTWKIFGWWAIGLGRPSPLFDDRTNAPRAAPRVLTPSERAALSEAQEDLAAAQAAVEQLRKDMADNQKQAQEFATHLNEYKALREDLDHIEGMHRAALDRLAKLQASERERAPRVELLEAAAQSHEPWRPNYRLDAVISVAGSLAFGLFAAWLADFGFFGAP